MRCLAVSLVVALCGTAYAGPKDPETARLASGITSAAAGAVALGGFVFAPDSKPFNKPLLYTGVGMLFIGPSAGELYSEQYLTWGMGIRAAAAGLAVWTLQNETKVITCDDASTSDQKCEGFTDNAGPILGVAAIMFIGGVWYDVLDAKDSAERYNKKRGFSVTPTALVAPQGMVPAVSLGGSF
jgi:hypothetical protein